MAIKFKNISRIGGLYRKLVKQHKACIPFVHGKWNYVEVFRIGFYWFYDAPS